MYQFTEDCLIGIPSLDEEHRKLFQLLNSALDSMKQPATDKADLAKSLLESLKDYAITHFTHEEAYMEKINDPELSNQKEEHAAFLAKVDSYSAETYTESNAEQTMQELLTFLIRWLYRHILSSDMIIGKIPPKKSEETKEERNFITFSPRYYTGIDFIDQEHKKLFEIIGEAYHLIEDQFLHDKYDRIMEILDKLKQYTEDHFHDEEDYMERINYSGINSQKRAHKIFVNRLVEVTYMDLNKIDENQQEYLNELMDFLLAWLSNHILRLDMLIPREK